MHRPKKVCPKCGAPGSGPYARWVLNAQKRRYEPYYYFAHKRAGAIHWCYLGKRVEGLSNTARCVDCAHLQPDDFCVWQGAYIKNPKLKSQPFECEGFKPKGFF
ncbi:MAG: hypothetical protein QXK47_04850 [Candidatus Bathyarchaeia archaeon]